MNILGIGGLLGHDANAALIVNGKIIAAAQEERFSGIKHDADYPSRAIADCLQAGNISAKEVDVVVLSEKPLQVYVYNQFGRPSGRFFNKLAQRSFLHKKALSPYEQQITKQFPNATLKYAWHHFSHAVSSFYSTNFEEASFLCIDGKGEYANASIGYINNKKAVITHELPYANGLGMLYTVITHFLGFPSFGSEYKVMGLAPYGKPVFADKIRKLYKELDGGAIVLLKNKGFHPADIKKLFPWISSILEIDPRGPAETLQEVHADVAASIQFIFESLVLKMAAFVKANFDLPNLLFCGGCAQNCVTGGKLRDSRIFKKVFISPVGGDMGTGLGAALAYMHETDQVKRELLNFNGYYLGSKPGKLTISEAQEFKISPGEALNVYMAKALKEGKIIGWVHNGMELGARALGARSIIANPIIPGIQSEMNLKIKFREIFRPFAPAILWESTGDWFELDQPSDYMQYTAYLKEELRYKNEAGNGSFKEQLNFQRCKIPSVVHVDYSARLQTITKEEHPEFYTLLKEFEKLTGLPMLINTSFNVNGQPIIRTANEAWECFINTDIDLLVIEDQIYRNPFQRSKAEKLQWLSQFENYGK